MAPIRHPAFHFVGEFVLGFGHGIWTGTPPTFPAAAALGSRRVQNPLPFLSATNQNFSTSLYHLGLRVPH